MTPPCIAPCAWDDPRIPARVAFIAWMVMEGAGQPMARVRNGRVEVVVAPPEGWGDTVYGGALLHHDFKMGPSTEEHGFTQVWTWFEPGTRLLMVDCMGVDLYAPVDIEDELSCKSP